MSVGNEIAEWLGLYLTEHLWGHNSRLQLDSDTFEVVGSDEVPGYNDSLEGTVLVRRKPDGEVFEVEIEVQARTFRAAATTGGK